MHLNQHMAPIMDLKFVSANKAYDDVNEYSPY